MIVFTIASLSSCKKKDLPRQIDYNAFFSCDSSKEWDSLQMATRLTGTWQLYEMFCAWTGSKNTDTMDVEATLDSSGNFVLKHHGVIEASGSWSVERPTPLDSTYFELKLSQGNDLLGGAVLVCADQVLFGESSSDGCDKVYNRVQ
ncbi:MAG TPA: hypothetical protein VE978_20340 [Chitinophagales bacterium]|nr:hypothetical protein [Chitinophagales bacterium]